MGRATLGRESPFPAAEQQADGRQRRADCRERTPLEHLQAPCHGGRAGIPDNLRRGAGHRGSRRVGRLGQRRLRARGGQVPQRVPTVERAGRRVLALQRPQDGAVADLGPLRLGLPVRRWNRGQRAAARRPLAIYGHPRRVAAPRGHQVGDAARHRGLAKDRAYWAGCVATTTADRRIQSFSQGEVALAGEARRADRQTGDPTQHDATGARVLAHGGHQGAIARADTEG
mmetsp:Transcript_12346/g.33314  ORF Transcript_12346/g.33314 Transcript_12346/m.33314 type:complete len:229 (-) Transcript_12346:20-706(-)